MNKPNGFDNAIGGFDIITTPPVQKPNEDAARLYRYGNRELKSGICIPSASNSYSVGIEYVKRWILCRFKQDYFKTVWVNGRHIALDYMTFKDQAMIRRDRPAIAFTPTVNLEYDRNTQDSYMGGYKMLINKFNHESDFFKDYDNNIFIGVGCRDQEIGFNIKYRVESREQQMDLYREIELKCRIGYTDTHYVETDCHIPMEIMLNVANNAGFAIDKNHNIIDINGFVKYVNSRSNLPIIYKLRGSTGRREFFMRGKLLAHISVVDKLTTSDGNRQGQSEHDFDIDMALVLHMTVPSYYVITSRKDLSYEIPLKDKTSAIGLWTVTCVTPPATNEKGWQQYFTTDYELDKDEANLDTIELDLGDLFTGELIRSEIDNHLKMMLSPGIFIDIQIFDGQHLTSNFKIDWLNKKIIIDRSDNHDVYKYYFAIYTDNRYLNDRSLTNEEERVNSRP